MHIPCLLAKCEERIYRPGEIIVEAGHEADQVYVVIEGSARIVYFSAASKIPSWGMVDLVGPGRLYGLVPAMDRAPYAAQLDAITAARVISVTRRSFLDEMGKHSEVAVELLKQLAEFVRNSEGWLEEAI